MNKAQMKFHLAAKPLMVAKFRKQRNNFANNMQSGSDVRLGRDKVKGVRQSSTLSKKNLFLHLKLI